MTRDRIILFTGTFDYDLIKKFSRPPNTFILVWVNRWMSLWGFGDYVFVNDGVAGLCGGMKIEPTPAPYIDQCSLG